jgi:hypothetical protein
MKIQKVIFSCSEEYSDFWEINSKVFKEKLNIEPVCLLFTENKDFVISEQYGSVRKMQFIPNLPKIIQITWSKFYFTKTEPDTTWMIGDIDQVPLQKEYFFNSLKDIPNNDYAHLNYDGCGQSLGKMSNLWLTDGGERGGGFDLPAHYHVAKGKTFHNVLNLEQTFEEQIKILTSGNYGLGKIHKSIDRNSERFYWIAEEQFSSELIRTRVLNNSIKFHGFSYSNRNDTQRIGREAWNGNYNYNIEKLVNNGFIDIHCHRPYIEQEDQLMKILDLCYGK